MRILILNWRDIKNPAGGGAEILTHELAKGWVKQGYKVTQFSSRFGKAKLDETIDGVRIIRKGQWWNVHFFAFFYYLNKRSKIDIIIDEVHWFPFFSAVYARKKTIALTCETASKLFFILFPYPLALIFRAVEKIYLRVYKDVRTMTISDSTKKDLIKAGVNRNLITVLPMGLQIPKNLKKYPKEKKPTLIYLARLNKQKGIFDAIEAFRIIKEKTANKTPQFWIVGSGDDETIGNVKKMIDKYHLTSSVKFFGFVSEGKKYELLAKAHILIIPSAHEGWGLTAVESALQGTPVVGYDIPGLRDSVDNGKTGILSYTNPESLARDIMRLLDNRLLYDKMCRQAQLWAKHFNWEKANKESIAFLKKSIS